MVLFNEIISVVASSNPNFLSVPQGGAVMTINWRQVGGGNLSRVDLAQLEKKKRFQQIYS